MSSVCLTKDKLKAEAKRLGFHCCGIAPVEPVPSSVQAYYSQWIAQGRQAEMHYLENYADKRFNPELLVPGARSIVSLAISYHPGAQTTQKGLAWYAQGRDYHDVVKEKLTALMQNLGLQGRCFVDTGPVLEKYWAWRCGLGFIGRHTQLVIPHLGSAFFLGELFLIDEADAYDTPMTDDFSHNLCGPCHRCLDACPSGAISAQNGGMMDASRCLSYQTIEQRGPLPEWAKPYLGECFYGCDRCLRACPHLHEPDEPVAEEFCPREQLLSMTRSDWEHMTVEQYRSLFKGSAVKRAKYEGLMRNIHALDDSTLDKE